MHGEQDVEVGAINNKGREILPGNVIPRHYDLTLEPDLENFTFKGTVVVDLDVVEKSSFISLNTLELEIQKAEILSGPNLLRWVVLQRQTVWCYNGLG